MQKKMQKTYFTKPTNELPVQLSSNSYTFVYFGAKEYLSELIAWKVYYDKKRLPPVPLLQEFQEQADDCF